MPAGGPAGQPRPRRIRPIPVALGLALPLLDHPDVQSQADPTAFRQPAPVHVRVLGPDAAGLTPADLRRLFKGRRLTPERRARLAGSGRMLAVRGERIVGLAAYERTDAELRVHEFAVEAGTPCVSDEIASALIGALEIACLASGGRRLVLLPRAAPSAHLLRARGFAQIAQGAAGSWFEKLFPA